MLKIKYQRFSIAIHIVIPLEIKSTAGATDGDMIKYSGFQCASLETGEGSNYHGIFIFKEKIIQLFRSVTHLLYMETT